MKIRILILFLFLREYSFAQKELDLSYVKDSIVVLNLESYYKMGDSISFQISNISSRNIYISNSLVQNFATEGWVERIPDLDNYECDLKEKIGIVFFLIKSHESKSIVWDPRKANKFICFDWTKNKGMCRIYIRMTLNKDDEPIIKSTQDFSIK